MTQPLNEDGHGTVWRIRERYRTTETEILREAQLSIEFYPRVQGHLSQVIVGRLPPAVTGH